MLFYLACCVVVFFLGLTIATDGKGLVSTLVGVALSLIALVMIYLALG